jgi:hypothetical protein
MAVRTPRRAEIRAMFPPVPPKNRWRSRIWTDVFGAGRASRFAM